TTHSNFVKLNAVSSGVADAKKVIDDAKRQLEMYRKKTYLLLDECHRWSKAQSDCMLSAIEKGEIIFIGSTTENPFVCMTKAIVSRCRLFEFKPLGKQEQLLTLQRAIVDKVNGLGNYNLDVSKEALEHFVWASNGDVRSSLNALELAVLSTNPSQNGTIVVDKLIAEQSSQRKVLSIDDDGYYDMLSAFCKSLRGSDSDAGLYWAERLIQAGCDPMIIARRLIAHSSEDIGMANSEALVVATSAMYALQNIGMPEAKLNLFHAIIYLCESAKSDSVYIALERASELVKNHADDIVPNYLRVDAYNQEKITGYKYPHEFGGWVEQDYLPQSLRNERLYAPKDNGQEKNMHQAKIDKTIKKDRI
ncbi:MAG: replication-associated recombination protein A, partial [Clostridia bacterium]